MTSENGIMTKVGMTSLRKVECILCQKVVFPPVMQCKNWHLICNNCRPNLSTCPGDDACKEDISSATRSGVSEKFLEKYIVRCKYFNNGLGCLQACTKEETQLLVDHEEICDFREVVCLVPGCSENVRLTTLADHFESAHSLSSSSDSKIILNASEIIMQRKGIFNETCGEKTYKSIACYLKKGSDIFLAIFRISSLRSLIFEISTIVYPYFFEYDSAQKFYCKISAKNSEDANVWFKWEGPLSQGPYPIAPSLNSQDETVKLKWIVEIEILKQEE